MAQDGDSRLVDAEVAAIEEKLAGKSSAIEPDRSGDRRATNRPQRLDRGEPFTRAYAATRQTHAAFSKP
jgi:hypothetical protein